MLESHPRLKTLNRGMTSEGTTPPISNFAKSGTSFLKRFCKPKANSTEAGPPPIKAILLFVFIFKPHFVRAFITKCLQFGVPKWSEITKKLKKSRAPNAPTVKTRNKSKKHHNFNKCCHDFLIVSQSNVYIFLALHA